MGKKLLVVPSVLAACAAALLLCGPAQAAAPANDGFAAATPLTVGTEISGTNVDATVETGEPNPTNSSQARTCVALSNGPECGNSVWYTFQPASSGEYTIDACDGGTDFESVIGVYTGSTLGSLTELGYSLNGPVCPEVSSGDGKSQYTFNATGGTVYHVDVTGYQGEQGSFYLRAYPGAAHARPSPDTEIIHRSSLSDAINTGQSTPGVRSGPRHTASFALFSHTPGATFECSLDGAAFAPCAATVSFDDLAPGSSHVFSARAMAGAVADPTPLVERFTLDGTPPETTVTGPSGAYASQTATWATSSSKRYNQALSRCGIDGMPTVVCGIANTYEGLCAGPHTFRSAAVDYATNVDPTPASASIAVTTGPPCAGPTLPNPAQTFATETSALMFIHYDDKGAGGHVNVEYGTTTAYGTQLPDTPVWPGSGETTSKASMQYLTPGTLYHFRVTITTPFGSATSADQTVMTQPLESPLPTIENGTPTVAGEHAVTIPATIDPKEVTSSYLVYIEAGAPVTPSSPLMLASENTLVGKQGPQAGLAQLVDLEASTTYHYRFLIEQQGSGAEVLGPEGTFTTPPFVSGRLHFELQRKQIKVSRLTARTRALIFRIHGLPAGTAVSVQLGAGKKRAKKSGEFKAGKLTLKVRLTRRFRDALLGKGKLRAVVTATPPGDTSSSVGFTVKLHKPHRRHRHG